MVTKTEETKAVVQYKGEPITITFQEVKRLICPLATDQEAAIFLKMCQSLNLNPFASEIYLVKYSEKDKAAHIIAIESYSKAAELNPQFDGYESGIVLDYGGRLEFREGAFLLDKERENLVGGWAKVYRKDRSRPFYVAVNKRECIKYRKDGSPTEFWSEEKRPSMLRKVALKRALVEAFPSLFGGGAISTAEVDYELLPSEVSEVVPKPQGETPEGELPPAFEKNGEPDWKKWWARQKEKGLDPEEVHSVLGITSLKTDWLEQGRTLEEAEDIINDALEKASQASAGKRKAESEAEAINTFSQLYKACFQRWKLQPKDVLKELGVSSQTDLAITPQEAFRQIRAVRENGR